MKKWKMLLTAVLPMTLALSFPAMAGQWHEDMNGWWYENDDGSYARNGWYWIDGNQDGWAECYYFGNNGYMAGAAHKVEGYETNADGAWTVNGEVQRKSVPIPGAENDPEAVAAYQAALEKNSQLNSYDVDAAYTISMIAEGASIDMGMDLNLKTRETSDKKLEFLASGSMDFLGSEMPLTMFYKDGYMYTEMMGMKIKQPMSEMEAIEEANSSIDNVDMDLSMMRGMKMRTEGENTIIAFNIDTAAMNELLGVNEDAYRQLGMDVSTRVNDYSGEVFINKDGYYDHMNAYMDMEITMAADGESTTVQYKMNISMAYKNPGQPVNFDFPSTEGYEEIVNLE